VKWLLEQTEGMLELIRPGVAIIDGLFSGQELDSIAETPAGLRFVPQDLGRNFIAARQRAETVNPNLSDLTWSRIGSGLPSLADFFAGDEDAPTLDPPFGAWMLTGCNPTAHFYKYQMGASFEPHQDQAWWANNDARTVLTVLMYLPAEGCLGGETVIAETAIPVVDGRVVIFNHEILHEAKPVERGVKLTLRTDVIAERPNRSKSAM
jgi:hypothetical protein